MSINNIIDILLNKINLFFYIHLLFKKHIWIRYAIPKWKKSNHNWGDDINPIICKLISQREVIPYQYSWRKKKHFLCIGSIIQWYSNKNAIIWGSGLLEYTNNIPSPYKVLAVRGPLTRKCLVENGIECPEIYGDPALLFPKFYNPKKTKLYNIGIICHYSEIEYLKNKLDNSNNIFLFIDIRHYQKWEYFIDKILSCNVILSSSLHGIIIADAYKVPNRWCQFTKTLSSKSDFKFKDYFLSVNKKCDHPLIINFEENAIDIEKKVKSEWKEPLIDLQKLLDVCPFNVCSFNK